MVFTVSSLKMLGVLEKKHTYQVLQVVEFTAHHSGKQAHLYPQFAPEMLLKSELLALTHIGLEAFITGYRYVEYARYWRAPPDCACESKLRVHQCPARRLWAPGLA